MNSLLSWFSFFFFLYILNSNKTFLNFSRQTWYEKLYFTDSHLSLSLAVWLPFCAPVAWSIHLRPVLQGTDDPQLPLKSMGAEHATHDTGGPRSLTGAGTYRLATYWQHHRSSHLLILKPHSQKKKKKKRSYYWCKQGLLYLKHVINCSEIWPNSYSSRELRGKVKERKCDI